MFSKCVEQTIGQVFDFNLQTFKSFWCVSIFILNPKSTEFENYNKLSSIACMYNVCYVYRNTCVKLWSDMFERLRFWWKQLLIFVWYFEILDATSIVVFSLGTIRYETIKMQTLLFKVSLCIRKHNHVCCIYNITYNAFLW